MQYACHSWKAHHQGRKKGHVADKTKIMIFSKGPPQIKNHNFMIGSSIIEVVSHFKYLGVTFSSNGKFVSNINELKKQGIRAIFDLIKKVRKGNFPIDIQFGLFDKTILSKLLQGGSEVTGGF